MSEVGPNGEMTMKRHMRMLMALSLAVLTLSACDLRGSIGDKPYDSNLQVNYLLDDVNQRGRISFGGVVSGEFVVDAQAEAYVFAGEAGAEIAIENTQLGTARALDSVLYLYGPAGDDGSFADASIAWDDDSGWGLHAEIDSFTLPAAGDYLMVLGTYGDYGRGQYRIELRCLQDDCAPACTLDCDDGDPCTEDFCHPVEGCLHELVDYKCSGGGMPSGVEERGSIEFGGEVFGEFVADQQRDGYLFSAAAGALLSLDNTNLGSSQSLDSMLFLYGPADAQGNFGAEAIAIDDDSGWGVHARIADFTLPAPGQYLVVIGTYADTGRGRYRLELRCEQEICIEQGPIRVSKTRVLTAENNLRDNFTVSLAQAPTEQVVVLLESSDVDEAVIYPARLVFCPAGFHVEPYECALNEEGDPVDEWSRTIEVSVIGVNDAENDGDQGFSIALSLQTEDLYYGSVELVDIVGVNSDQAAAPDYSSLDGLADEALIDGLYGMLREHFVFGYSGQNSARNIMFSAVDLHDGQVECIYTGMTISRSSDSSEAFGKGLNTEHTWPQSQFDKLEPMKSDLHHIFPSDVTTNSYRASYDFGMTTNKYANGSVLGSSVDSSATRVFQVRPERRGDVARAHFYLVARYRNDTELGVVFDDDSRQDNGAIKPSEESVLRAWHIQDPVDATERRRNDRIEAYQGNRNPFIDQPGLVERISDF